MAIAEVSIVPVGTGSPSTSDYVAKALKVLREEKSVKFELTAMGTLIEGDLDRVMTLIRKMHESVFEAGARRAILTIKIDDRRDRDSNMDSKVRSVMQKL